MATFNKVEGKIIFTDNDGIQQGFAVTDRVLASSDPNFVLISSTPTPPTQRNAFQFRWEDIVPLPASRNALITDLCTNFFNGIVPVVGGTQDVNIVQSIELPAQLKQNGENVSDQNPLSADFDRIYATNIDVANSDIDTFNGVVTDFFDSLTSLSISPPGINPRVIKIWFNATIAAAQVGLGCNDPAKGFGTDITLKILGSAQAVRQTITVQGANPNSQGISFTPDLLNGIQLEFNTTGEVALSNIVVKKVNGVSSQLQGIGVDGFLRDVRVTPNRDLGVDIPRDIFGNLPVSDQTSIWDSTSIFDYISELFYTNYLTGAASIAHQKNESSYLMSVGVGEVAARQLKTRTKYQPLKAHKNAITLLSTREVGVEKYFGYGDLDDYTSPTVDGTIRNGVFVMVRGPETFLQLWNNGVQVLNGGGDGIERANWNIDKLDGTGQSRISLDLDYCQISIQEMEWLGVGSIVYFMNIEGRNIPIHRVDNANYQVTAVYMRTANLSPIWMIKGITAAGSMKAICNAVISGGGHNPIGVPRAIENQNTISIGGGGYEAILFLRLKPEAYEANVNILGIDGIVETSGDAIFRLLYNPTWSGGALTWIDAPNSHVQYAQAVGNNNITDEGILIEASYVSTDNDAVGNKIVSRLRPGKSLQGNVNQEGRYDIFCLAAQSFGGTEVFRGVIKYEDV